MDETEYRAWAMISFLLIPTLMAALKRSGTLSPQQEADIYEAAQQQLEHVQAMSGDQAAVVQRARAIIEQILGGPRQTPADKSGPT
jgi:hypothetical protein